MTPVERLFEGDKHGAGPGLHRMSALLSHPELSVLSTIPTARVAGTNGKGSSCAFLSEILRASGRSMVHQAMGPSRSRRTWALTRSPTSHG